MVRENEEINENEVTNLLIFSIRSQTKLFKSITCDKKTDMIKFEDFTNYNISSESDNEIEEVNSESGSSEDDTGFIDYFFIIVD